ncbi:MAG TPA: cytochrome c biogenesis protein ResB, partial [Bacteroidales bacterium]
MRKVINIFFSSYVMVVLILIFAVSIAVATFIENDFGTSTARATVYNSWWFTAMLFIGIINLTGTIFIKRLYRKEKQSIFLFHLAFLFILTGSAITRYLGFEGYMHIRSGQSSNQIVSSITYLQCTAKDNMQIVEAEKKVYFSELSNNYHRLNLHISGKNLVVECLKIIPNASETLAEDNNGVPMIELVAAGMGGRQTVILESKQTKKIGDMNFSFNDTTNAQGVSIVAVNNELKFKASVNASVMNMATQMKDTLNAHDYHPFQLLSLYNFGGLRVVAKSYFPTARVEVASVKDAKPDQYPDALYLKASYDGQSKSAVYFASSNELNDPTDLKFNDVTASVSFGPKIIQLPFSLQLDQFILKRYPGSMSPSSFESNVVLNDNKAGIQEKHRIFMNNVLKYKGYRFYQSSYDTDEQGTVLSVNHDFWGTIFTYFGYLMLAVGIVFSVLNRNSRFRKLSVELVRLRETRKMASVILFTASILLLGSFKVSAEPTIPDSIYIDKQHAAKFGELLIQDPGGRIKPINSLGSELLHKISRKDKIMDQTSDQVLLGMLVFPEYWQTVPMIRVGHPEIMKILHIQEPFVSFSGILNRQNPQQPYLLYNYVNDAFQKKPASRTTFDTEMLRLDERINLCSQIYSGELLRIFPKQGDVAKTWYSPVNTGNIFHKKDSIFVNTMVPLYIRTLHDAAKTKDLKLPEQLLGMMSDFQNKYGGDLIPSSFKVKLEILYNKLNIFDTLGSIYGVVGFLLLVFQFISIFFPKMNLKPVFRTATILI